MTSAEFSYLASIGYAGSIADKRNAYYMDLINQQLFPVPNGLNQLTQLQAVINSAPPYSVLTVNDRYRLDGPLTVNKPLFLYFTPRGEFYSGAGTAALTMVDVTSSDVFIQGFGKITGPQFASAANQNLIRFTGPNGLSPLTNVGVKGLRLSKSGKYAILASYVKEFNFDNNTIDDVAYTGIGVLSGINGSIDKNVVRNVTQVGYSNSYGIFTSRNEVDLSSSVPRSENISICGNRLQDIPLWDGINTHGGKLHTISNNILTNVLKPIELVGGQISGGAEVLAPLDMNVIGNVINSAVTDGTRAAGIMLVGADGSGAGGGPGNPGEYATGSIIGNIVRGHGDEDYSINGAILCYYTRAASVIGNTVIEPSPIGINFYTTNSGFLCVGNSIIDPWTNGGLTCSAINCRSDYNTGYIANNILRLAGKSAAFVGHRGLDIANLANNSINLGQNDFSAATTAVFDQGNKLAGTVIPTGSGSTASRPSASGSRKGSSWFDTTLNKPIWSDGTNWRDATGATV